jgi:hypothetical protein
MSMTHEIQNRHPADELADVRAEIKRLETHRERLRSKLLADGANLIGDEWEASISFKQHARLDAKAATEYFGAEAMKPFMRRIEYQQLDLKRRKYEVPKPKRSIGGRRREQSAAK